VPPAGEEGIDRATPLDPGDRYPSAAALRDALDEVEVEAGDEVGAVAAPAAAPAATSVFADAPDGGAPEAGSPTTVAATGPGTEVLPGAPPVAPRPAQGDGRGRRWALVAVAALVVLAAGALLLASVAGDGDGTDDVASDIPDVPEAIDEQEGDTPEADTPEADTPAGPTEGGGADVEPVVDGDAAEAVVEYYALLDAGRIDEGFALLSPAYQQRTGEDSYRGFWSTVAGVEVLDASGDDGTVVATLRYTMTDGGTSTERTTLRVVADDSGTLLIDDHRVG
jgi:hypothetical protein